MSSTVFLGLSHTSWTPTICAPHPPDTHSSPVPVSRHLDHRLRDITAAIYRSKPLQTLRPLPSGLDPGFKRVQSPPVARLQPRCPPGLPPTHRPAGHLNHLSDAESIALTRVLYSIIPGFLASDIPTPHIRRLFNDIWANRDKPVAEEHRWLLDRLKEVVHRVLRRHKILAGSLFAPAGDVCEGANAVAGSSRAGDVSHTMRDAMIEDTEVTLSGAVDEIHLRPQSANDAPRHLAQAGFIAHAEFDPYTADDAEHIRQYRLAQANAAAAMSRARTGSQSTNNASSDTRIPASSLQEYWAQYVPGSRTGLRPPSLHQIQDTAPQEPPQVPIQYLYCTKDCIVDSSRGIYRSFPGDGVMRQILPNSSLESSLPLPRRRALDSMRKALAHKLDQTACTMCGWLGQSTYELVDHVHEVHLDIRWQCECKYECRSRQELVGHARGEHEELELKMYEARKKTRVTPFVAMEWSL